MDIYRNNNYTVQTGESASTSVTAGTLIYVVINNHTGVVEAEDSMLPRIIDYADQLDEKLIEMEREGFNLEIAVVHGLPSLDKTPQATH